MLTFEEARTRILSLARPLPAERVGLDESSGRVLCEDVLAHDDFPAFDYSAMDGYAVRCADLVGTSPHRLPVRGESRAGSSPSAMTPGAACRIFTGAPLPDGSDAVVMQEEVTLEAGHAVLRTAPKPGAHIRRRGEDFGRGHVTIPTGTRLRPSHIALAASCDRAWLSVSRRPIVSLIGTGDELRAPGSGHDRPGSIAESNGPGLKAMAAAAGAHVRALPFAPDDREAMTLAFDRALSATDLFVTVGGVSVGDHDLVRPVLEGLGVVIDFWKVAIKPGKPLLVGKLGQTVTLGIPGNPTSAMVTFALFGVPLLRAMQGDKKPFPEPMRARLARDVRHAPGRLDFVRVTVARDRDGLVATPIPNQASGATSSMASADALACLPADAGDARAGDPVEVLWLSELGA